MAKPKNKSVVVLNGAAEVRGSTLVVQWHGQKSGKHWSGHSDHQIKAGYWCFMIFFIQNYGEKILNRIERMSYLRHIYLWIHSVVGSSRGCWIPSRKVSLLNRRQIRTSESYLQWSSNMMCTISLKHTHTRTQGHRKVTQSNLSLLA